MSLRDKLTWRTESLCARMSCSITAQRSPGLLGRMIGTGGSVIGSMAQAKSAPRNLRAALCTVSAQEFRVSSASADVCTGECPFLACCLVPDDITRLFLTHAPTELLASSAEVCYACVQIRHLGELQSGRPQPHQPRVISAQQPLVTVGEGDASYGRRVCLQDITQPLHLFSEHLSIMPCFMRIHASVSLCRALSSLQDKHGRWLDMGLRVDLQDGLKAKVLALPQRELAGVGACEAPAPLGRPRDCVDACPHLPHHRCTQSRECEDTWPQHMERKAFRPV